MKTNSLHHDNINKFQCQPSYRYRGITLPLKSTLNLIFEFIAENKKVSFIGFPDRRYANFSTIFRKNKQYNLKNKFWLKGLLSNFFSINRHLNRKSLSFKTFKQKIEFSKNFKPVLKHNRNKTPDLVVIYALEGCIGVVQECCLLKIPFVIVHNDNGLCSNNGALIYNIFSDSHTNFNYTAKLLHTTLNAVLGYSLLELRFRKKQIKERKPLNKGRRFPENFKLSAQDKIDILNRSVKRFKKTTHSNEKKLH